MTQDRSSRRSDQDTFDAQTQPDVAELKRRLETKHQECRALSDAIAGLKARLSETGITERKQAEQDWAHQQELLQGLYDNIPILLVIWEPHLQRFSLNRHAETVLGWTNADANEGDFMRKVYPDDAYRAGVTEFMQALGSGWREWATTAKTGESIPIDWANIRLSDETMIGIGIDLRDRKMAERTLRESNERLRLALEATQLGIWEYDPRSHEIFLDERSRKIFGTTDQRLNESALMEFVYPEDRDRIIETVKQGLDPLKGRGVIDFRILRSDGRLRWANSKGKTYFVSKDSGRKAVQAIGTCLDITERKQAEKALKESAERFRLATEVAEMYGWEFDLISRSFTPFENAEKAVRFPVPKGISEVWGRIHPDDYSKVRKTMDRAVAECGEFQVEYRINPSRDKEFWVFSAGVVITEPHGRPTHVVGVTQNITGCKHAEAELRQLNESLERRVAERTELANARAKQLQSLSVELIKAEEKERRRVSELLHDDLQQLLASAKLHLEGAIRNLPETTALSAAANLVKESIGRSRRLSHELSPPLLRHSSLLESLDWLTKHVKSRFGLKVRLKAETECHFGSVPLKMFLFRAVQEFLFNVVKHAGVKSAEITLSGSGDCCLVSVRDQGRGFNPDTLEASNPKTRLGLLSVRERANYMGIDLTIQSAPGQGSRVTLAVPRGLAQDTAPRLSHFEAYPKSARSDTTEKVTDSGDIRMIFVDDHQVMREALVSMVRNQPEIEVVGEACNGQEALDMVRQVRPNLIVMDVSMPVMDGVEATARIRNEFPDVRVIGLSMHHDAQVARSMHQAGAAAFLTKSVSSDELLKAIYNISDQTRQ